MYIIEQPKNGGWTITDTNARYSRSLWASEIEKLKIEFPLLDREATTFIFCIDRIESVGVLGALSMTRRFPERVRRIRNPSKIGIPLMGQWIRRGLTLIVTVL